MSGNSRVMESNRRVSSISRSRPKKLVREAGRLCREGSAGASGWRATEGAGAGAKLPSLISS